MAARKPASTAYKNKFGETYSEFKARIQKEGLFKAFSKLKQTLKKESKITVAEAQNCAMDKFPPNPSGPEFIEPEIIGSEWDEKPTCNAKDNYDWLFEMLYVMDTKPEDSPSRGAWEMWVHYQKNPALKTHFYTDIYIKFIPSKAQLDRENKRQDNGQQQMKYIDECIEFAKKSKIEARAI